MKKLIPVLLLTLLALVVISITITHPESDTHKLLSSANFANVEYKCASDGDEWIYYSSKGGLFRFHSGSAETEQLLAEEVSQLFVEENWLYYMQDDTICRMDTGSLESETIFQLDQDDSGTMYFVWDGMIYATVMGHFEDGSILSIDPATGDCCEIGQKDDVDGMDVIGSSVSGTGGDLYLCFWQSDTKEDDFYTYDTESDKFTYISSGGYYHMFATGEGVFWWNADDRYWRWWDGRSEQIVDDFPGEYDLIGTVWDGAVVQDADGTLYLWNTSSLETIALTDEWNTVTGYTCAGNYMVGWSEDDQGEQAVSIAVEIGEPVDQ